ncbi:MAG TPA: hypothetical protein VKY71_00580 [Actinotalea caeni]|uniref:LppM family (lipo)protein n=1 Tax=Actinotalea caeni TaxID=1348467 RepID=UPI002B4B6722|nr:hypothetical protein [Actinotalea caeni]HLV54049.1 hypothetical protein [Actinotalea caeni]
MSEHRTHGPGARPARRAARLLLAAVLGLLVLAGCVRVDGDLTLHGTAGDAAGTVSGTVLVAVSDEWAISQGQDPARLGDVIVEELATNAGDGVTGEPFAEDGFTGVTLTLDDVPADRLADASDGALTITREGDSYVLRGDLSVLGAGEDQDPDAEGPPWTVRLSVTMPEDVIEHDGRLEGRTVTWELDESTDPTMLAVSSVGPVPWWSRVPVPLLVLVVVAGIGAVVAWRLSRGSPAQDRSTADGGFRARQAAARGGSTSKLDDMLAAAKDERRGKGRPAGRGGAPRGRRR